MAASTVRFALIVALVVGGVVIIDQAFPAAPSTGAGAGGIDDGGIGVSPSPTSSPATAPTGPTGDTARVPAASPTVLGVRIAVFNGTEVAGLAGNTQETLTDDYGYVAAQDPADAPEPVAVTTIYYRARKDEVEARFLAEDFFKKIDVVIEKLDRSNRDVGRDVQLAVYLGEDYASQKKKN